MSTKIGQTAPPRRGPNLDLRRAILDRIRRDKSILVWAPNDFLDLGPRSAVDKTLQRLALLRSSARQHADRQNEHPQLQRNH
jgi:hypothetical protein